MFNPAVSFVRVLSMLLILVTHFLSWKNINSFQIATVGVAAFLFISGYLYGTKEIKDKKDFCIHRVKRVLIPFWILSAFLSLYLIIQREYILALQSFLETLFNLQGIHSVVNGSFKLGSYRISGLAHCWFLTVIVICYLLVAAIKNSKIERFVDEHLTLSLFIITILHLFLSLINIAIGSFVIFFVGYFFKRAELKNKLLQSKYTYAIIALSLVAFMARVLIKRYIDDTPIYNIFVASFASNICAVCFFLIVHQICKLESIKLNNTAPLSMWGG